MDDKPATAEGYPGEQVALVRSTCLYVATKLGDLIDDLVVVGGLVPSLLVDLLSDDAAVDALAVLRRDFLARNAVGPRRVAEFLVGEADDAIQADTVGHVRALLSALGQGRAAGPVSD
ncbi:MAG: hypothetical protein ABFS86_17700 [Planctomycetota bacterium]